VWLQASWQSVFLRPLNWSHAAMQRSHATPDGAMVSFMAAVLTPRPTGLDWIGILIFRSSDVPMRDDRL
jgi:hypothetical protein